MATTDQPNTRTVTLAFTSGDAPDMRPRCFAGHLGKRIGDDTDLHPIERMLDEMNPLREFEFPINMSDTAPNDLSTLPGDMSLTVAILTGHDNYQIFVDFYDSTVQSPPAEYLEAVDSASRFGDVTEHAIALDSARMRAAFEPTGLDGIIGPVTA